MTSPAPEQIRPRDIVVRADATYLRGRGVVIAVFRLGEREMLWIKRTTAAADEGAYAVIAWQGRTGLRAERADELVKVGEAPEPW
jgi:hypothetical protein